ncbi:MAG: sulfurtransferase [Pseudomonadota bacterium]|nr:sulfurtransferase [Pseudomonadota bacterium]
MSFDTLITVDQLQKLHAQGNPLVVLDCGFDLSDPASGRRAFDAGHIPGASYADLDHALSGSKTGRNGRHPLPDRQAFAESAGRWGIAPGVQVVTYDAQGMPYAARCWWLLRWLGHHAVAVLDGGTAAWCAAGGAWTAEAAAAAARPPYPAAEAAMPTIDAEHLLAGLGSMRVLDARAAERFRGDVEPLDAVGGHIPGAKQRFFKHNLQPDGCFKPADALRAEFEPLLAGADPTQPLVQQCGSGVTACHNLLAMAHAGLGVSTLYPGSWSEWSSDPMRPVARGE